jgi:chemotaxis protein MotB
MRNDENAHQEIIIIKRGNEEEEGHHGGAWKIAFADFMTAMMALFLVLWLINAANEETKRAVASYFNPVKLVDRNRSSKGVNDQRGGPTFDPNNGGKPASSTTKAGADISTKEPSSGAEGNANDNRSIDEARFFASPFTELDAIERAGEVEGSPPAASTDQPSSVLESFTDPFAFDYWQQDQKEKKSKKPEIAELPNPREETANPEKAINNNKVAAIGKHQGKADVRRTDERLTEELRSEIRETLTAKVANADPIASMIEVKSTDDGVLISVTDTLGHPMFEVGSALPAPSIVLAVDAIAKSLSSRTGQVHIYGHTDGRQYQNDGAGNWRLSTERARASYLMLLRGGLDDQRITEIAGFADRKLRVPSNPLANENRRIEILLETK